MTDNGHGRLHKSGQGIVLSAIAVMAVWAPQVTLTNCCDDTVFRRRSARFARKANALTPVSARISAADCRCRVTVRSQDKGLMTSSCLARRMPYCNA